MDYDANVFIVQFPLAKRFVYHVIYYRALFDVYDRYGLECEFWIHTIDAHLLQAAMLWCMIFGSDGCNPTHWKNLAKAQTENFKTSFRKGLPKSLGIDWQDWQQYWKDMKEFRSKYAAHRELVYDRDVPNLDLALKTVFYYDSWVRELISPDIFEEPLLEETAARVRIAFAPLSNKLIENTKKYQENDGLGASADGAKTPVA